MAMAAAMEPSSPRLPSPPPPPEIQLTPGDHNLLGSQNVRTGRPNGVSELDQHVVEENSRRRIHPGTKAADMEAGPPLVPLLEVNSAFQLQEHLAALHYSRTQFGKQALTRVAALEIAQVPAMVDEQLWLYELCRFLIAECNKLIVGFLFDTPACSASTCPEMRASEWQFLCAVHEQPKSCCAIDYCCHTLDWAANVVTNHKTFPSRFASLSADLNGVGGETGLDARPEPAHSSHNPTKNLINVFRRVHRIFAHAWFQHRNVFWSVESQTGLYLLFKVVCDTHKLIPGETYRLPPEAEGLESATPVTATETTNGGHERAFSGGFKPLPLPARRGEEEDSPQHALVSRSNTRRHIRSSPSTGSAVTTVMEADEDEGSGSVVGVFGGVRTKVTEVKLESHEEEQETADVPVIVEHEPPSDTSKPQPSLFPSSDDEPGAFTPSEDESDAETTIMVENLDDDFDFDGPEDTGTVIAIPNVVVEPEQPSKDDATETQETDSLVPEKPDSLTSTSVHDFAAEQKAAGSEQESNNEEGVKEDAKGPEDKEAPEGAPKEETAEAGSATEQGANSEAEK